jgi:hypothetical protein
MTGKRILMIAVVAVLLCGALFFLTGGHRTPVGQPPLAELDAQNFTTLENAFNAANDNVRILLLLSPT